MAENAKHNYDESKIKTLSSLEHIRLRTGMYIGRIGNGSNPDDGCYILLKEVIDNAIDAMHGKGELRVRTYREDGFVVVEIGDNGPGISADVQPHIFEPFFTTKRVGEGTGLGLDTVQRIVKKHRGNIQVTSKPGDTCFQVWLPVAAAP